MFRLSALTAAVILDWLLGEPKKLVHPVCLMGNLISRAEKQLRKWMQGKELTAGIFFVILVLAVSVAVPGGILRIVPLFVKKRQAPAWGLEAFWGFQLLAAKSLYQESAKVRKELEAGKVEEARRQVSYIVGRDTERLDQAGITRAAVETVAENTSDGVIAPLMFMAVFGVLGGFFYKAVNTMDSMVGYRNERYYLFGRAAARLDDICNFLPARLTGLLLTAAAFLCAGKQQGNTNFDGKNAWKMYCRDRKKHDSPNSAHGEAACAGALHIRLAGDAWYFGEKHKKPWIGDDDRPIEAEDIRRAGKLMVLAEILALGLCWMVWGCWYCWRER